MGWMNDLFGGAYDNPADSSQKYLDEIPGYADKYMNPYINTGNQAGNILQNQYSQMAANPTAYYNSLVSTYEPSAAYKYQSDQLAKTQANTAAAGGFSGTAVDQDQQMTTQNALLNQDLDKYLAQILGIQGSGLQGEQSMYNTGYGASTNALNSYINYANSSAQNQFAGTQADNASASGTLGLITKGAGAISGFF